VLNEETIEVASGRMEWSKEERNKITKSAKVK